MGSSNELEIKTLDDLYDSIGGVSKFHWFMLAAILYPELPSGIVAMLPVFVGAHPQTWVCSNEEDILYYINSTGSSDQALCSCNGTLTALNGSSSIISEWNLVCEYAWVTDFITSLQMAGVMIGASFGSQIPDLIGRKLSIYLLCLLLLCIGIISGLTSSLFVYAGTRFLIGLIISPYIITNTIYVLEVLPSSYRTLCGCLGPWSIGVMLLALLAYYIDSSWETLSWVSAIPIAIQFISYPFIPESPRWLLQKGKIDEAKKAIDQMASWNGFPPVDVNIIKGLSPTYTNEKDIGEKEKSSQIGYVQFITNPALLLKITIFTGIWFVIGLIYYGVGFNTKNLGGNPYLNMVYMGLVEAIGFPSAIFVNKWLGRRYALLSYLVASSLAFICVILMELEIGIPYEEKWVTFLALVGRLAVSGAWGAIKCFTAESFATDTRSTAIGICTVSASIGGIIAPQLVFLGTIYGPAPYIAFGGLSTASMFLGLLLTETKGKSLLS